MNRHILAICGLAVISVLSLGRSQEAKVQRGMVCGPLHFSGITLGLTDDSEVQRLLGKGVSHEVTGPGETRARYFIDEPHTATLHVVSYTDFVVGEATLQAGIDPAILANERKLAESKWFKPADGFGNWHALHLGSSKDEVIKNLGEPKERVAPNDFRYYTTCECELPEYFDVVFKNNKVVKVVFSAPAG
jgi:hypothetical protein